MDNAENNITCIKKLGELLADREFDIEFDADQRRVMCHPHLVNLCAKHVNEAFTMIDASKIEEYITTDMVERYIVTPTPVDERITKEDYIQAIRNNPLEKVRSLIRSIHSSGMQRDAFQERIKVGNSQGWHKYLAKTVIPAIELLHEVATCWDSCYLMVNCVRVLRLVCSSHQSLCIH